MKDMNDKTFKQRIFLWVNRFLFSFRIEKKGRLLTFVIPEKYKRIVRTINRALTLVSLFLAFFAFQSVFVAFGFGLIVYILISALERVLFSYTSLYVHPLPDFEIEPEKWLGVFWGFAKEPTGEHEIPLVGLQLSEEDYARKLYSLILKWNHGELKDEENNIRLSAIVTDDDSYVFFCYPSFDRKIARWFFEKAGKERGQESADDLHNRMAMMLVLAKNFDIIEGSYFPTFRKRYEDGVPYLFQLGVAGEDGAIRQVEGTEHLIMFNLKIMNRRDLTRKDLEYDMLRLFE